MFKRAKVVMLTTNEKAIIHKQDIKGKELYLMIPERKSIVYSPVPTQGQHLYILSDEEIKEGDWVIPNDPEYGNRPWKYKPAPCPLPYWGSVGNCKKIIATTDKSLTIGVNNCDGCIAGKPLENGYHRMSEGVYPDYMVCQKDKYITLLPQPSQSFIQKFVEEYNKGNVITEVMVKYESYHGINTTIAELNAISGDGSMNWQGKGDNRDFELKINPKDNTISIRKVKNNWDRREMENILFKFKDTMCVKYQIPNDVGFTSFPEMKKWIEENL